MSQRQERVAGQIPFRIRRISLLPTSITSASLSHKPANCVAPSPNQINARKINTISAGSILKRRTSCSTLSVSSSTLSSALGKRRLNTSPPKSKGTVEGKSTTHSPPFVSEFGALQRDCGENSTVNPPNINKILPRHTISGQAAVPIDSLRQTNLPTKSSRISLRPSTAGNRLSSGETFPLKASFPSSIPRPRMGSSTPTRATVCRQSGHEKAMSSVSIPSKSPSYQLKPLASNNHVTPTSSKSTVSVKSRAAIWGRISAFDSSPSPSPRQKGNNLQSTPTQISTSESRPAYLFDEGASKQGRSSKPLPDRTRRISMMPMMPQTPEIPQLNSFQSRPSNLIAVRHSASVTAPLRLQSISSKTSSTDEKEDDVWGRWKAGTPAQCDEKISAGGRQGQDDDDSRGSLCASDFINASMLLDGKMLDELDAEVGRLGLDESTTTVDYENQIYGKSEERKRKQDEQELEIGKREEKERQEEMKRLEETERRKEKERREERDRKEEKEKKEKKDGEILLEEMTQQRDYALYRETQMREELDAARAEIEEHKEAITELERERQRETAIQTQRTKEAQKIESDKAEINLLQRRAEMAQINLTNLALESICQEWKHATDLACNHLISLENQSEISNHFFAQLEMFQQSIEKLQCNDDE